MNKPTDPLFTKVLKFIQNTRQRISYKALLGAIIGLAISIVAISTYAKNNVTYIVKVNNKAVGYIQNLEGYNKVVDTIKSTDGIYPVKHISVQKTKDTTNSFLNNQQLDKVVRQDLHLKMPIVSIMADNVEIARVQSMEDANKVLDGIKKYYYPKVDNGTVSVISSNIKENISFKTELAYPDEALDVNDAIQKIVNGRGETKTYTVQNGDTIWDIAMNNNLDVDKIQSANPNLDMNNIHIGQQLNLAVSVPYLNVEIQADIKDKEQIPYDTKEVVDNSIVKGVSKVKQSGKNGLTEIERQVAIVNGETVSENVVSNKVLSNPVEKVVAVGGKAPVNNRYLAFASGSGTFGWPSRGIITSPFGPRSRGFHTGMDIAVPIGTPVHAADGGVIEFAGWNGGYGNCIIINHGNGYETLYGHSSRLLVHKGQRVSKGQVIAYSGSTGNSTGPHIHFEVRRNGKPVNPMSYLR